MNIFVEDRMKARLPAGFSTQAMCLDQVEEAVHFFNTYTMHYLGIKTESVDNDLAYFKTPGFDLANDTLVVRSNEGMMVGYVEFWNIIEPYTRFNIDILVHPDFENRGIDEYLLAWANHRAEKSMPKAPDGAQVVMSHGVDSRETMGIQFLEAHGFQRVRQYYHMHIELDREPDAPVIPDGFVIRPYQGEAERIEMIRALWEAFHDHWGFFNEPFEKYYERWVHWGENFKDMDPNLWTIAVKDGKVAGSCLSTPSRPEDPEMGWVNQLGVRREYRKLGLGLALLQQAFGDFYRRGKKRAGLGVDAGSLTGALRLYENAGMHAARTMYSYQKILREGVDLSIQTLEREEA
jgi:mycothiol synthase